MQPQIHPMMEPVPKPKENEYPRRHGSLGLNEIVPVPLEDLRVPMSPSSLQSSLKPPPRTKSAVSPFPIIMEHTAQQFLHRNESMDSASVSSHSSVMSSSWVCTKCSYSNVDVYNERCAVCGIPDPHHRPAPKTATSWLSIASEVSDDDDDEEESEPNRNLLPEQQTATSTTAPSTTAISTANTPKRPSPEDSFSEISSPPQRPTLPLRSSQSMEQQVVFPGSPNCQDDDVHSVANHSVATVKVSNINNMPAPQQRRTQSSNFAAPTFNVHRTISGDCLPPAPLDEPKTPLISNTTNTTRVVRRLTMPTLGASTHSDMTTSTHSSSSSAHPLASSSPLEPSSSACATRRNSDHQLPSRKIPVPPLLQKVAAGVHTKPKARPSGVRQDCEHPSSSTSTSARTSTSNAFAAEDWEHPARRQMKSSSAVNMSTPSSSRPFDAPLQKKSSDRTLATTCSSRADEPNHTPHANEVELIELGGRPTTAPSQRSRSSASLHSSDPDHVTVNIDSDPPKRHVRKFWLLLFLFAIAALIVGLSVGVATSKNNNRNTNAASGLEATKELAPTMTPTVVDTETPVADPTLAPEMVSTPTRAPMLEPSPSPSMAPILSKPTPGPILLKPTPAPILLEPDPGGGPVVLPPSVTDRVQLVALTERPLVGQSLQEIGTKVVIGGPTGDWIAVTGAGMVGVVEFAWDPLSANVTQEQDRKGIFLPVGNDPTNGSFVEPSNDLSVALSEGATMAIASNGEMIVRQLNVTSNEWQAVGQHVVLGQKDRIGVDSTVSVPTSVALSGDASIVASGILLQTDLGFTTVLQVWQYLPHVELWGQMFYMPERLLLGTTSTRMDVELSTSGETMVVAIHGSYQVQVYQSGNETFSQAGDQKIFQNLIKFHGIALSGDGRTLAVVRSFDTVIFLYDGMDKRWTLHSILIQGGTSVSLNYVGGIVAIGDDAAVDVSGRNVGKVAVFLHDPSTDAYDLVDQVPGNENSRFGESISVSEKRLAVGAPSNSENGFDAGSVHLYTFQS
jgi:hypothetical protein